MLKPKVIEREVPSLSKEDLKLFNALKEDASKRQMKIAAAQARQAAEKEMKAEQLLAEQRRDDEEERRLRKKRKATGSGKARESSRRVRTPEGATSRGGVIGPDGEISELEDYASGSEERAQAAKKKKAAAGEEGVVAEKNMDTGAD